MTSNWARRARATLAVATVALAIGFLLAPGAAIAAEGDNATFADTSQTVEYGSSWGTTLNVSVSGYAPSGHATYSYTGTKSGSGALTSYASSGTTASAYLNSGLIEPDGAPLAPGTYLFSASFVVYSSTVLSSNTYRLTVTPAAIGTDLRVVADAANPANAVVSAVLTGDYIASIGGDGGGPALPAGTWHLNVKDADKKLAFVQDTPQAAGGAPHLSAYWTGVGAGPYTASASFEVAPGAAGDFALTNADGVKFAPSALVHPAASASPSASTAPAPLPESAMQPPAWTLGGAAILLIGLIIGGSLATRQLRRRRSAQTAEIVRQDGHASV